MNQLKEFPPKRILLKLSGEMLGHPSKAGMHTEQVELLAGEISQLQSSGIEVGVVSGGGNFFRGAQAHEVGLERSAAD